jgi:hypothetical protein
MHRVPPALLVAATVNPTHIAAKDTLTVSNGAGATGTSSIFAVTTGSCI